MIQLQSPVEACPLPKGMQAVWEEREDAKPC